MARIIVQPQRGWTAGQIVTFVLAAITFASLFTGAIVSDAMNVDRLWTLSLTTAAMLSTPVIFGTYFTIKALE